MNHYQRKALFVVIAINVVFGLHQYFINEAVVFPSPINPLIFLLVTVFFCAKLVFKSTWLEKCLMMLFLLVATIQFLSDSFTLEIFSRGEHTTIYKWMNSMFFGVVQFIGVVSLLITLPLVAYHLKTINRFYFYIFLFFTTVLTLLAFINMPFDPLLLLGAVACMMIYVIRKHGNAVLEGVRAAMHLWILYFIHEFFEYWNLLL